MATEQFMPQYVNWNNLEEVWAQIKNNFIAAYPAAKGDMIYWSSAPTSGVNANPAASVAHLSVPAAADQGKSLLGIANGVPAWRVVALGKTEATSKVTIGISLGGTSVSSVDILEANASRAGVITTLEQTIKGDKHLQGNFDATGGVAATGLVDLDMIQSGGAGTVTAISVNGNEYVPPEGSTVVTLPNYPVVPQTYDLSNITSAADLQAIEILSGTGYLQRTGNNTWALRGVSDMRSFLGIGTPDSASGVPLLDGSGKLKLAQFPDAILGQLVFGGTVDASGVATLSNNAKAKTGITSDKVTLSNSAGTSSSYGWVRFEGCFFIMDAGSSFASLDLKVGDWLLSTGTAWKKVDNTDAVTSVNGQIGAVTLGAGDVGAVAKTGDTMSGKLTISSGGLEVTGASKFNSGITLANAQKLVSVYSGNNYDLVYCDSSGNVLFGNSSRPTTVSGSSLSLKVGTAQILGLNSTGASVTGILGVSGEAQFNGSVTIGDQQGADTFIANANSTINGTLSVSNTATFGANTTINAQLAVNGTSTLQDIVPKTDDSYAIGNTTKFYSSVFANKLIGKTKIGMYIGNTNTLRAELDNTGLSVMGGVSALGITDLDMIETGGSGTVTSIRYMTDVSYEVDREYFPAEGSTRIDLPALTWGNVSGKPTFAAVATSGSYNDLSDKPNIPQGTVTSIQVKVASGSNLTVDTSTAVTTSGSYTIGIASGYSIPANTKQEQWDTAYSTLSTLGTASTHAHGDYVTAVSIAGTTEAPVLSVTKGSNSAVTTLINAATLQGYAASHFTAQSAFENAVGILASGLGQVLAMAQDNAENINMYDDRITDLESGMSGMTISHYQHSQTSPVDSHLITLRGGQQMYLRFNASTQGKFELAMASDDNDTNLQEFSFGTMTAAQIQAICHL